MTQSKKLGGWVLAYRIALAVLALLLAAMAIQTVAGILSILNTPGTRFPWHSAFFFVGLYYALPVLLTLVLCLVFRRKAKQDR